MVANKADNVAKTWMMHDFHPLGMGTPYPISAASGTGTEELLDEVIEHLPTKATEKETTLPKVATCRYDTGSFTDVFVTASET